MKGFAATLAANRAKNAISKAMTSITSSSTDVSKIDWEDYNYPPLIRMVHFRISELKDPIKSVVKTMHISFLLIVAACLINIISNIVEVAIYAPKIHMLYTFLNLIIIVPVALYIFYTGYKGLCRRPKDERLLYVYKIGQALLCACWIWFSVWNAGAFNGWIKIGELLDNAPGCIAFVVLESMLYVSSAALGINCIVRTGRVEDYDPYADELKPKVKNIARV